MVKPLFKVKVTKVTKGTFKGLFKAETRNNKGDKIIIHGKTGKQARQFATGERDDQNKRIDG